MTISRRLACVVVSVVCAHSGWSCGGGDKKKAGGDRGAAKTLPATGGAAVVPKDPASTAGPQRMETGPSFDGFDLKAAADRWQGAWVIRSRRPNEAWKIEGERITIFDGKTEETGKFAVVAPCAVDMSRKMGGLTVTSGEAFVFDGDTLLVGSRAGVRKNGILVACLNGPIYIYRDGSCDMWHKRVRRWKYEKSAKCNYRKADDGTESLSYTSKHNNDWGVSSTGGDTFFAGNRKKSALEKFADFEAAKKALSK